MNFLDYVNTLTVSKCMALIRHPSRVDAGTKANLLFAAGDHWQNQNNPVAKLVPLDIKKAADVMLNMQNDFTPLPLIEEVVERAGYGLVGREPAFSFTVARSLTEDEEATTEEAADIAMADTALGAWWDKRDMHETIQELTSLVLLTQAGYLNPVLPPESLAMLEGETPRLKADTIEEALDKLYAEVFSPRDAMVYTHPPSRREIGLVAYTEETEEAGATTVKQLVRVTWVNDAGKTVLRVLADNQTTPVFDDIEVDAGGELLVAEAKGKPFITEPVRRMQHTVNLLNSMLPRNAKYAGFRARHGIGIKPPTDPATGLEVKPNIGAGTFNLWQGVEYEDADGNKKVTPAQLITEDPVDSRPLREDIAHLMRMVLRSTNQLHTEMSDDATASAVSRIQARAAFAMFLLALRPKIEGALRSFLRGLIVLAAHIVGDEGQIEQLKALRVVVDVKPYTGPLAPDEINMVILMMDKGLISREMAMVMTGIEDIDAEREKLASQDPDWAQVDLKVKAFASSGLPSEFIWQEVLGLDDEQMARARAAAGLQEPRLTGGV